MDQARPRVRKLLETLGFGTGRITAEEALSDIPQRIVRNLLKELKAEHAREIRQERVKNRVHKQVLAQGTMGVQDSTHTGVCRRRKTWAEVARDVATTEAHAFGDGKPLTGDTMVDSLEAREQAGTLPLVLGVDNGPGNKANQVIQWAEEHQLVLLFNRPRTPTDNSVAERCAGEGKARSGLGTGVELENPIHGGYKISKRRTESSTSTGPGAAGAD
jgi:transposase InsO family protein